MAATAPSHITIHFHKWHAVTWHKIYHAAKERAKYKDCKNCCFCLIVTKVGVESGHTNMKLMVLKVWMYSFKQHLISSFPTFSEQSGDHACWGFADIITIHCPHTNSKHTHSTINSSTLIVRSTGFICFMMVTLNHIIKKYSWQFQLKKKK